MESSPTLVRTALEYVRPARFPWERKRAGDLLALSSDVMTPITGQAIESLGFHRPNLPGLRPFAAAVGVAACLAVAEVQTQQTSGAPGAQPSFSRADLASRTPIARLERYRVNARVRPLLLFWVGRDDVGTAEVSWRRGTPSRRAIELVIGTNPERAPRRLNRWGFIAEEVDDRGADVIGVMRESKEETFEEADAETSRSRRFEPVQGGADEVRGQPSCDPHDDCSGSGPSDLPGRRCPAADDRRSPRDGAALGHAARGSARFPGRARRPSTIEFCGVPPGARAA